MRVKIYFLIAVALVFTCINAFGQGSSQYRFSHLDVGDGLKRTIAYVQSQNLPHQVEERWITIEVHEHKIAELLTELARAGVVYSQIWVERPTLEYYFLTISQQARKK